MHSPYTVDKILADVDSTEARLEGHVFAGYASMSSQIVFESSGSSQGGHSKKITQNKSTKVVENYSITNRALPWIAALSQLLEETGFNDRREGDVWKWAAGDGKVLKREGVKSMYEMLLAEMKKQKQ